MRTYWILNYRKWTGNCLHYLKSKQCKNTTNTQKIIFEKQTGIFYLAKAVTIILEGYNTNHQSKTSDCSQKDKNGGKEREVKTRVDGWNSQSCQYSQAIPHNGLQPRKISRNLLSTYALRK